MEYLFGKPVSEKILLEVRETIARLGLDPGLGVLLVGDDPASHLYVNLKEKAASTVGIRFEKKVIPTGAPQSDLLDCIEQWNRDPNIHGILVQIPLPEGYDTNAIINAIDPKKDADGFHRKNIEDFLGGARENMPVFPLALMELLESSGVEYAGKTAVAIVHSDLFGKILQKSIEYAGMTPSVIHQDQVREMGARIAEAGVVFTACGVPGILTGEMIAPGAIVIDGGISKVGERVVGDADAESLSERAQYLAPVPGGVGPVTIACLLRRVTQCAEKMKRSLLS